MTTIRLKAVAVAIVLMLAPLGSTHSHTGATGIVKERMVLMETLAAATKALKTNIMRKASLTVAARRSIAADAQVIERHALKMLKMFPPGSNKHPSEALPSIWKDWPGFEKSARNMAAAARNLKALSATGDRKALLGAFVGMARNCSGCHAQYRLKKR